MPLKMSEREARAFYAQIGRPYPGDPDPRAARVGLAAVAGALSDGGSEQGRQARARRFGLEAVKMALEGGL